MTIKLDSKILLHPELKECLKTSEFGTHLQHKLCYELIYTPELNDYYNKMLEHKKALLEDALKDKDYHSFVFLHERPFRLMALIECWHLASKQQKGLLVAATYVDAEMPMVNQELWIKLFKQVGRTAMSEEDVEYFESLPDEIEIYRGCLPEDKDGISWTLSKEQAQWFANRFNQQGKVFTKKINKNQICTLLRYRQEEEVIFIQKN